MRANAPLHVHVSTLFMVLILVVGSLLGFVGYRMADRLISSVSADLAQRISRETSSELRLLTEQAPPTSFLRDAQPEGYAVEVVRELIRRTGSQARIELLPWTRAYFLAKSEADTGLFSVVRTAEREALFQWSGRSCRGRHASIR